MMHAGERARRRGKRVPCSRANHAWLFLALVLIAQQLPVPGAQALRSTGGDAGSSAHRAVPDGSSALHGLLDPVTAATRPLRVCTVPFGDLGLHCGNSSAPGSAVTAIGPLRTAADACEHGSHIWRRVAEVLELKQGVDYELSRLPQEEFGELLLGLQSYNWSGKCAIAGALTAITPDRQADGIIFSEPVLEAQLAVMVADVSPIAVERAVFALRNVAYLAVAALLALPWALVGSGLLVVWALKSIVASLLLLVAWMPGYLVTLVELGVVGSMANSMAVLGGLTAVVLLFLSDGIRLAFYALLSGGGGDMVSESCQGCGLWASHYLLVLLVALVSLWACFSLHIHVWELVFDLLRVPNNSNTRIFHGLGRNQRIVVRVCAGVVVLLAFGHLATLSVRRAFFFSLQDLRDRPVCTTPSYKHVLAPYGLQVVAADGWDLAAMTSKLAQPGLALAQGVQIDISCAAVVADSDTLTALAEDFNTRTDGHGHGLVRLRVLPDKLPPVRMGLAFQRYFPLGRVREEVDEALRDMKANTTSMNGQVMGGLELHTPPGLSESRQEGDDSTAWAGPYGIPDQLLVWGFWGLGVVTVVSSFPFRSRLFLRRPADLLTE